MRRVLQEGPGVELTAPRWKEGPWTESRRAQFQAAGPSGASYQVDIQVRWDDEPNGDIRVLAGIDDGGWRAFAPLTEDFILGPDGRFVGE